MPRRPVNPQDRQRVVRACDQCKSSKKRCDGSQPCKPCERKGYHGICHYTAGRRLHPLPRQSSTSSRLPTQHPPWASDGSTTIVSHESFHDSRDVSLGDIDSDGPAERRQRRSEDTLDHDTRESSMDALGQPPVMLSSTSGEKGQHCSACCCLNYPTCDWPCFASCSCSLCRAEKVSSP
jgi:hypothetical protein